MAIEEPVVRIGAGDRTAGDPTPGMVREQAIAIDGMWAGYVRTEPHATSGWHHHGDNDATVYVVRGRIRLEFGPDGSRSVDAAPGDFVHVPKGVVHRESNPGDTESHVVVVRAGHGLPTVNVNRPSASSPSDPGP